MNLVVSLIIFILFWRALLATIFSYQLHKENEDYAGRLGERLEPKRISKTNYMAEIHNSLLLPVNFKSLKIYLNRLSLIRIRRLILLKITLKYKFSNYRKTSFLSSWHHIFEFI